MKHYSVEIEVPINVLGYAEVQANSLEEALNLALEQYWKETPSVFEIPSDGCKETAFPIEAWIGPLEGEHTEFTRKEIDQAWETVQKVRGRK